MMNGGPEDTETDSYVLGHQVVDIVKEDTSLLHNIRMFLLDLGLDNVYYTQLENAYRNSPQLHCNLLLDAFTELANTRQNFRTEDVALALGRRRLLATQGKIRTAFPGNPRILTSSPSTRLFQSVSMSLCSWKWCLLAVVISLSLVCGVAFWYASRPNNEKGSQKNSTFPGAHNNQKTVMPLCDGKTFHLHSSHYKDYTGEDLNCPNHHIRYLHVRGFYTAISLRSALEQNSIDILIFGNVTIDLSNLPDDFGVHLEVEVLALYRTTNSSNVCQFLNTVTFSPILEAVHIICAAQFETLKQWFLTISEKHDSLQKIIQIDQSNQFGANGVQLRRGTRLERDCKPRATLTP